MEMGGIRCLAENDVVVRANTNICADMCCRHITWFRSMVLFKFDGKGVMATTFTHLMAALSLFLGINTDTGTGVSGIVLQWTNMMNNHRAVLVPGIRLGWSKT
jgi:hypothetical protein